MQNNEVKNILIKGAAEYSINLSAAQIDAFFCYKDILKEWNNKINLTAIQNDNDIIIKHFIDSLSIFSYIKNDTSLIDVGTGAGFPGIPIKIANSSINVTLLDSLEKRIKFLNQVIIQIKLEQIETFHGRAEDFGNKPNFRESFDYCTARAVTRLPVLLEYCLPFVKVGGYFIAMKGNEPKEELDTSKNALSILGGEIIDIKYFTLPFSENKRSIIFIKKFRQTPGKYPRKPGVPLKNSL